MTAREYCPKDLQTRIERLSGMMDVTFRPMFGGIMVYAGRKPFSSLSNRGMAFKLSFEDRQRLIEIGGVPLQYEPSEAPSKSYTVLPDLILNDESALRRWLARSVGYVIASTNPRKLPKKSVR